MADGNSCSRYNLALWWRINFCNPWRLWILVVFQCTRYHQAVIKKIVKSQRAKHTEAKTDMVMPVVAVLIEAQARASVRIEWIWTSQDCCIGSWNCDKRLKVACNSTPRSKWHTRRQLGPKNESSLTTVHSTRKKSRDQGCLSRQKRRELLR